MSAHAPPRPGLDRDDLDFLAAFASSLDLENELEPWQPIRYRGRLDLFGTLCLDDFSAIPFLDVAGAEEYQHRARLRAGDGDLYAAVCPPSDGYEAYCADLGLGSVGVLLPDADVGPMEVARGCLSGAVFARLVDEARRRGGLRIHPYMGIEAVWELGRAISEAAAEPVEVLAPPPPVTWIANDKGHLSRLVAHLVGDDWIVETRPSATVEQLVRDLRDLARRHPEVALKRLRCASATGNKVLSGAWIRKAPSGLVAEEVRTFLARTEWDGGESVLAVAWERSRVSPSTQVWIPGPGGGAPVLDGIYEQILVGDEGTFVGSRPSRLPDAVHRRLAAAVLKVASGLQHLGYVGRCSFDHLVVGDPDGDPELRFVECNGRWGGTSIPMHLVDRLVDGDRPPYRAQDVVFDSLVGLPFAELRAMLEGHLYDPGRRTGTYVLYNPGPLREVGKIDVIALADSQDEAEEAMEMRLPSLLRP